MGATGFGYEIAERFGLKLTACLPGLVPLTFDKNYLRYFADLSGISVDARVTCGSVSFRENILITHRGVSGPAILQISSYWREGDAVSIDLLPDTDVREFLTQGADRHPDMEAKTLISQLLPKRLVQRIFEHWLPNKPLKTADRCRIDGARGLFSRLADQPSGNRRLSCGGGHCWWCRCGRNFIENISMQKGSRPLFYRRSAGRNRLVRRV